MSKPNKLSRGRSRKKATQPTTTTTSLNDSSDDFSSLTSQNLRPDSQVEIVVAATPVNRENDSKSTEILRKIPGIGDNCNVEDNRKKRLSNIFEDDAASKPSPTVSASATPPSSPPPPPQPSVKAVSLCPLCSKHALPGHLKSCAIRLGLTTQQVVELRRMDERHREDRRKLGVPEVPVTVVQEKSSKVRVTRRKAGVEGAGADPDLALALALSISAGASSGGGGEMQERVEPTEVQEMMWLPQPQVTLKRRGKRVVGQTVLQSRSDGERERIIGEKVAKLLEEEMGKEGAPDQMERTVGRKGKFGRKREESNHYWSLAANLDTVDTDHLMAAKLEHFLQLENCKSSSPPPSSTPLIRPAPQPVSLAPGLAALSYQWLSLLQSAQASDMTILCKEEVEVPCHSLVLTVRCPLMMKSVVREGSGQIFLVMDQYEYTVVKVVLHYLYGGVLNTGEISEREQLVQLRNLVTQNKMNELNSLIGELQIEEVDDDEEEVASFEDCADDKIVCGTQSLDVLLECLDNESQENDRVDGDEWDEVCEYMTQMIRRSVASEEGEDEIIEKIDNLMHDEEHEVMTVVANGDKTNNESESELSLRLEESFKSDTSCKLKSVEKLREPSHIQEERSTFLQEAEVSLCRAEPSSSCPTENVPTESSFTSKLSVVSVVSRSSSPDMFEMSDDDTEVTQVPSNSQHVIQTGVKRKSLSHSPTTPSPHKRPCPDYSSDELPTPAKYTASPAYTFTDQIVDLTQPTPPDSHVGQIESPPHILSPSSQTSSHHISISSPTPSPPMDIIEEHDDGLDNFEEQQIEYYKSPDTLHPNAPLPSTNSSPPVIVPLTPPQIGCSADAEYLPSCTASKPPPPTEPPDMSPSSLSEAELVSLLTSLSSLLTDEDSTPTSLVSGLVQLATVPVTVPVLLSTGVGKVVRRLKDREGKVGRLAGKLVSRWKRIVLQYEPPPSTAVCQTRSDEGAGQLVVAADQVETKKVDMTVSDEVNFESAGVYTEGYEVDIDSTNDHKNEQVHSQYIPGEDDQNLDLNQPHTPKLHIDFKKSHSVLEQTGLGSPHSEHLDQEEFDLPDHDDVSVRSHSVLEKTGLASQHYEHNQEEHIDYDLPDRGDVWDDFDEGTVSLGTEHVDNFALAEASEMWTSSNDPAVQLVTHPPSHLTPVRSISEPLPISPVFSPRPLPVTPLPDYHGMLTPHLKAELKKFGLKAVPRRKACLLLNHIYDQTHPLVPSTPLPPTNRLLYKPATKPNSIPDLAPASQPDDQEESDSELSQDSFSSQDGQVPDMPEESILHDQEDLEDITPSQVPANDSLHSQLSLFLYSRPSLVQSVMLYQPLWLGQLVRDIKEAGIKCKVAQLQDWLDIHCITFRTESSRNRNKAAKEPGKKSTKQKESEEVVTEAAASQGKARRGRKKH